MGEQVLCQVEGTVLEGALRVQVGAVGLEEPLLLVRLRERAAHGLERHPRGPQDPDGGGVAQLGGRVAAVATSGVHLGGDEDLTLVVEAERLGAEA